MLEDPGKKNAVPEAPKKVEGYQRYQELGGIIDEEEYGKILLRAGGSTAPDTVSILQAGLIARTAGIALHNETGSVDKRVALYGILRTDPKSVDAHYHLDQMNDQRLFVEVLRIVGDADSLQKFISTHPNIHF